ncbi:MAG: PEP-CTERM sorting domain-containing protein [Phycisphaeraceae bacterium]|nr:PEP-CTERM sorting domain-containing protein [Phycisphaeraceae bacterium]
MNARMLLCALAAPAFLTAAASGQIITQWNFNSNPPDGVLTTGTTAPNIGAGTISVIGGVTTSFASGNANGGSTDPDTGDNSGWQTTTYPAQGTGSGTAGIQALVSTVGHSDIIVSWDQRHSNTSSRFWQFQYTLDGETFSSAGLADDGIYSGNAGDTWFNGRTADLTGIAGAANNANFGFRVVAVFDPAGTGQYLASSATGTYGPTGTSRFDMVTVVPAPGALALLGLGCATALRRRR